MKLNSTECDYINANYVKVCVIVCLYLSTLNRVSSCICFCNLDYDIGRQRPEKVHHDTGSYGTHLQSFLADGLGAELCRHCHVEPLY